MMSEKRAVLMAAAIGGETWQSGGGIWLVVRKRTDGRLVVASDECICEYPDEGAFERAEPSKSLLLT